MFFLIVFAILLLLLIILTKKMSSISNQNKSHSSKTLLKRPRLSFANQDEINDMLLEKFIALNPLYLIDEEEEKEENKEELSIISYRTDSSSEF